MGLPQTHSLVGIVLFSPFSLFLQEEFASLLQNEDGPITDWFNGLKDSLLDIDPFTVVGKKNISHFC